MKPITKNWNDLPKLMDVHELTKDDDQCLQELQAIIERRGLSSKFVVALLHKHFEIEEDEVLLESNDPVARTLTSNPIKTKVAENGDYATTIWRFDDGHRYGCSYCQKDHCD